MKYALGNMLNGAGGLNADGLTLDLQFATDKTLAARKGPTPTFTRASAATFIGSNGLIQSAAINAARFDHDPSTLVCRGLLVEETRTNLVFPSDTLGTQTRTVTAASHTLSFYGTGTVVISGAHVATVTGTGEYPTRTTLTFTPSAGSLVLTVTGSVTQAQLEAGAFATSYIPTTTASVVRSADVCSITGSDFTGFYNQSEGTFLTQSIKTSTNINAFIINASDNSFINGTDLRYATVTTPSAVINVAGAGQTTGFSGTIISGASAKQALTYKLNDCAYSLNGAAAITDTSALTPTVNRINFGSAYTGQPLNGHIAAIRYFKKRLSNAKLQTLTT